jgi:hypothetical protein
VGEELLHTDGGREELGVVDEGVAVIVELFDDLLQLLRAYLMMVVH